MGSRSGPVFRSKAPIAPPSRGSTSTMASAFSSCSRSAIRSSGLSHLTDIESVTLHHMDSRRACGGMAAADALVRADAWSRRSTPGTMRSASENALGTEVRMRLIQFRDTAGNRAVAAITDGGGPRVVRAATSVRDLALEAHRAGRSLSETVKAHDLGEPVDYDALIKERRVLVPLDHPEPSRMIVALTGLT